MSNLEPGEYDAVINDVRLHYTVRGKGPALLAHSGGPGMDARGWDDFAGIDRFLTVIALHPRGSGLSAEPADGSYRLQDYARDLEGLRQHLGLEAPALIGWSHGGMVAMRYAIDHPDRLSKLILYDTSAYFGEFLDDIETAVQEYRGEPWFAESYKALQAEWAGDYETDQDMADLWAEEMKFYFHRFGRAAEQYHERTKDLPVRIAPLKAFNEGEADSMDLRAELADVHVPALVIVGRHDFITNVSMALEMVKALPDARLRVFEDSGHFSHIEQPEAFAESVRRFLLPE
jgi:proline iminopeptidase